MMQIVMDFCPSMIVMTMIIPKQSLYATGEGCAGVSCEEIRDTNTSMGLTLQTESTGSILKVNAGLL